MHGYGFFAWANGDTYSGNWIKGKISGYGIKSHADGLIEKGNPISSFFHSFIHCTYFRRIL